MRYQATISYNKLFNTYIYYNNPSRNFSWFSGHWAVSGLVLLRKMSNTRSVTAQIMAQFYKLITLYSKTIGRIMAQGNYIKKI